MAGGRTSSLTSPLSSRWCDSSTFPTLVLSAPGRAAVRGRENHEKEEEHTISSRHFPNCWLVCPPIPIAYAPHEPEPAEDVRFVHACMRWTHAEYAPLPRSCPSLAVPSPRPTGWCLSGRTFFFSLCQNSPPLPVCAQRPVKPDLSPPAHLNCPRAICANDHTHKPTPTHTELLSSLPLSSSLSWSAPSSCFSAALRRHACACQQSPAARGGATVRCGRSTTLQQEEVTHPRSCTSDSCLPNTPGVSCTSVFARGAGSGRRHVEKPGAGRCTGRRGPRASRRPSSP